MPLRGHFCLPCYTRLTFYRAYAIISDMYKKPVIGEGQMQIDYNKVDSTQIEPIPRSMPELVKQESSLTQLLRAHGTTEQELDDYAEKRGCSYDEAYRHFGISTTEVKSMSVDYPVVAATETISEDEDDIEKVVGPSALIAKRALHLTNVLAYYSKASQAGGVDRALDTPRSKDLYRRYSEDRLARIIGSRGTSKAKGDAEFLTAIGSQEMIDAGERPSDVGYKGQLEAEKFVKEYVGSKNRSDREKYRRVLRKQQKNFKKA